MSQGECSLMAPRNEYTHNHKDADQDYQYDDGGYDDDAEYEEITQEDCWTVISSFFAEKGLVRQQLDSFDEFVQNTMQELVDENAHLILDQGDQHTGHDMDMTVSCSIDAHRDVWPLNVILVATLRNRVWANISIPSYCNGGRWECGPSLSTRGPLAKFDLFCPFIH